MMSHDQEVRSSRGRDPEQLEKKRKRKHNATAIPDEELEIDINLPEPPSKKARRKEKKSKIKSAKSVQTDGEAANGERNESKDTVAPSTKRSEFGIWIGNLPFSTTSEKLKEFLLDKGHIREDEITRVNLPTAPGAKIATPTASSRPAPTNRGFAYIDFATKQAQEKAIALSETLMAGRPVLIKDAVSFEGRPQKTAENGATAGSNDSKQPSKKVFIGNLAFDVTRDDVVNLLRDAGPIEDCFLATFEDSGKCKGFGWMRFKTVEAAEAAVRGYVYDRTSEPDNVVANKTDQVSKEKKTNSRKKIFINKLFGRLLRCEFAEDDQTRYKKRFGKEAPKKGKTQHTGETVNDVFDTGAPAGGESVNGTANNTAKTSKTRDRDRDRNAAKEQRREERRKRHDARSIAPGKALANTPRASAAIVGSTGTKIRFDD